MNREERTFDLLKVLLQTRPHMGVDESVKMADTLYKKVVECVTKDELNYSLMQTKVTELGLTLRASNALLADEINTVRDLMKFSARELMKIPNISKKGVGEIQEQLKILGLELPEKVTFDVQRGWVD